MSTNKPIRVLHLLKNFEIGGVESSTINFANYLTDKIEFFGIFGSKGFYLNTTILNKNIRIFINQKNIYNMFNFFYITWQLNLICKRNKINIIHYHFRIYIPNVYLLKLFNPSLKFVYTHHSKYMDYISSFIFANYYIAIGETSLQDLQRYSFVKRRIKILKNGVSLRSVNETAYYADGNLRVGIFGRLEESKGIRFICNNIRLLVEHFPKINIIFRGYGTMSEEIKQNEYYNLNIFLLPPTYNQLELFSGIHIILVPSISINNTDVEGVPMIILEAMASGIPVIASDAGGITNVVKDGENGVIFCKNNIHSLIAEFSSLLNSSELQAKITSKGIDTIENEYLINKTGNDLISVYKNLLAN